jgi:shikimate kinase
MKYVLIGFMGSGKTSVATALAQKLGFSVIEMDTLVYQKTGCADMSEVFAKGGELLLRETEIALAKEYRAASHVVISTGGGVVMNKIILDYLKEHQGQVIFLESSFKTVADRVATDSTPRPLFQNLAQAEMLYQLRLPLYRAYSDIQIQTDQKTVDQIVQEITQFIESYED